jgi:hypothetical protein
MANVDLKRRVEILEGNMDQLQEVPIRLAAVEAQIVQLRGEMQGGFSAFRTEMREAADKLRTEIHESADRLRIEMRAVNDETSVQMRVLHEDLISRFTLLEEGMNASGARGRRARKTR